MDVVCFPKQYYCIGLHVNNLLWLFELLGIQKLLKKRVEFE